MGHDCEDKHSDCGSCEGHSHLYNTTGWCRICGVPKCDAPPETHWCKDALATTYQRDFFGKEVPHNPLQKTPFVPSLAKFAGNSIHQSDFVPKNSKVVRSRRQEGPGPLRPFDDRTTYNSQFPPKSVPLDPKLRAPDDNFKAPFYGKTSYGADYTKKPLNSKQPAQAPGAFVGPAFDGQSTYRDDFIPKEVPARTARQRQPLLPSRHTGNGTEYGAEFVPVKMVRCSKDCCYNWAHPHSTGGPTKACCKSCELSARSRDRTVQLGTL